MSDATPRQPKGRSRLVLGLFLLALGLLLFAFELGFALPYGWWQYFPVPLVALGLWGLLFPSRHLDRSGGVWLLASGVYCLIGVFDLWHLGWSGGWPVFVIAAGLSFILHRNPNADSHACGPRPRTPGGPT